MALPRTFSRADVLEINDRLMRGAPATETLSEGSRRILESVTFTPVDINEAFAAAQRKLSGFEYRPAGD
jgi:hypothetical protein